MNQAALIRAALFFQTQKKLSKIFCYYFLSLYLSGALIKTNIMGINEEYLKILRSEPPPESVKEIVGKDGKLEYRYIPKTKIQDLLLEIYGGSTKFEMLRETVGIKGMYGVCCLHYKHPVTGEWLFVTGTASLPHDSSLRLDFPNLESHCLLNAVKKIGVCFGQTLNQKEENLMPEVEFDKLTPEQQEEKNINQIKEIKSLSELKTYRVMVYSASGTPAMQELYENKLRELKDNKVIELKSKK